MSRIVVALLASSAVGFQLAGAQPLSSPAPVEELQATIDDYVRAYDAGSVDEVMAHWTENADFVDIHGRFHEGRELISALFRRGFADHPGRKLRLNSMARKFLSPEVAMDDGILELTDAEGAVAAGRYTVVWTKVDDKWLIRSARDIPIEPEEVDEAPQPSPLEALSWMVGRWESTSDAYAIECDCSWQLDNRYLMQRFQVTSEEQEFTVVTYIGFDPVEGRLRSWVFDSQGGFGGGLWTKIKDEFAATMLSVLPDARVGSHTMIWKQIDDDTASWQGVDREVAGELLPDAEVTYRRVK